MKRLTISRILHRIWVSQHQVDRIARFDPKTGEWVEFPLAGTESDPRRIDIDPTNPNRIFFSGNIPGRVGFIEVLPQWRTKQHAGRRATSADVAHACSLFTGVVPAKARTHTPYPGAWHRLRKSRKFSDYGSPPSR